MKYFRQRLLSLVNMGVEVDMTIWWVASVTPPLKNPGYAPEVSEWNPILAMRLFSFMFVTAVCVLFVVRDMFQ